MPLGLADFISGRGQQGSGVVLQSGLPEWALPEPAPMKPPASSGQGDTKETTVSLPAHVQLLVALERKHRTL